MVGYGEVTPEGKQKIMGLVEQIKEVCMDEDCDPMEAIESCMGEKKEMMAEEDGEEPESMMPEKEDKKKAIIVALMKGKK